MSKHSRHGKMWSKPASRAGAIFKKIILPSALVCGAVAYAITNYGGAIANLFTCPPKQTAELPQDPPAIEEKGEMPSQKTQVIYKTKTNTVEKEVPVEVIVEKEVVVEKPVYIKVEGDDQDEDDNRRPPSKPSGGDYRPGGTTNQPENNDPIFDRVTIEEVDKPNTGVNDGYQQSGNTTSNNNNYYNSNYNASVSEPTVNTGANNNSSQDEGEVVTVTTKVDGQAIMPSDPSQTSMFSDAPEQ